MPRYKSGYKRSSVTSSTGAISENAVVFQSSGGHTHDGSNSSLIETNSYSVWDFQVNTVYSTTPRADRQNRHIEQFRNFISNHVNNNVLEPAGVVLGENVINATNIISNSITTDVIAANAITANEIAAATITTSELATDAITSLNYSYTSGDYSNSGTFFNLSDGSIISAQFAIDSSGNASFAGDISGASGTFTGDLSGGSIDIGGSDSTSFHVDSSGNMWVGNASYSSAPFKVDSSGNLIVGDEGLGRGIRMDTSGNFWAGSNTFGSASTFKINGSDGTVTMAQSLLSAYNTSYYWGQLSRRNVSTTGQSSFNEWGLRLKVPSSSVYRNSGYTISIAPDNGASDTSYSKNLWIARSNVEDDEDYTLGNNRYYDPAIRLRYDANLSGGVITMYGAVDISGDLSPHTMTLIQNPVGTTYGNGVNDTPTYMITQMAGDNDYWRIYGESTVTNNGRMVLEVTDDQTELIILRHKKTYSPWTATEHIFSPTGLSTPSVSLSGTNVKDLFYGGSGNNAGKRIFIQPTQPSGTNGDIWIKP